MKTMLKFIILGLALINLNATSYYLANSGSDSNTGTSVSTPWKTTLKLSKINFKPGDKVLFCKGDIWFESFDISFSGTNESPIYFGSYGEKVSNPILDGNNELQYLIQFKSEVNNITIENIEFRNCNPQFSGGVRGILYGNLSNSNINIKDCTFHQEKISTNSTFAVFYAKDPSFITIDSCDFSGGSQMIHFRSNNSNHNDVHHIVIKNNNFHDISTRMYNGNQYDGGSKCIRMSMESSNGIGTIIGNEGILRDITISDNYFYKLSGIAIFHEDVRDTKNKNSDFPEGVPIWLVADKTSYNINILRNKVKLVEWCFIDWGRITTRGDIFPWSNCSENIIDSCGFDMEGVPTSRYPTNAINTHAWKQVYIEQNIISNVANKGGDGKGIILDYSTNSKIFRCDSTIVRGNIISGTGVNSTLDYAGGIHMSSAERCSVYNNICYNNKSGISVERVTSSHNFICNNTLDNNNYGFWYGCYADGNILKNNALTSNRTYAIKNNANLIYDNNAFFNNGKNYSSGTTGLNDVGGNPQYIDSKIHDYRLAYGSAFIDKGADLGINFDITHYPRNSRIDIGAYQYNNEESKMAFNLYVKVYLQGPYINDGRMSTIYNEKDLLPLIDPYNGTVSVKSIPENIVDWISLEIRKDSNSNSNVINKIAFLKDDGSIVETDGISPLSFSEVAQGEYYLVIKHRNHISIMSRNKISLTSSDSVFYDFTKTSFSTYGKEALVELETGIYGMYSGDGDNNGVINIWDYNCVGSKMFRTGYESGDLDLNSVINVLDFNKSSKNLFINTQVPN